MFLQRTMPVTPVPCDRPTSGSAKAETSPRSTTILVVEDDAAVRRLVTRYLTLHGFHILCADDGLEAQRVWAEHKDDITLLFTDVVMPNGLSGSDLYERLTAEKPDLKTLFTSGYNVELTAENGHLREGIHFIQKPYRPDQLLAMISQVLRAPH
jgi:DNA-binding NtrC family response regulator